MFIEFIVVFFNCFMGNDGSLKQCQNVYELVNWFFEFNFEFMIIENLYFVDFDVVIEFIGGVLCFVIFIEVDDCICLDLLVFRFVVVVCYLFLGVNYVG